MHKTGQRALAALDQAVKPDALSAPSWNLHPLKGDLKGHWALTVNGNWRMVFTLTSPVAVSATPAQHEVPACDAGRYGYANKDATNSIAATARV